MAFGNPVNLPPHNGTRSGCHTPNLAHLRTVTLEPSLDGSVMRIPGYQFSLCVWRRGWNLYSDQHLRDPHVWCVPHFKKYPSQEYVSSSCLNRKGLGTSQKVMWVAQGWLEREGVHRQDFHKFGTQLCVNAHEAPHKAMERMAGVLYLAQVRKSRLVAQGFAHSHVASVGITLELQISCTGLSRISPPSCQKRGGRHMGAMRLVWLVL